MFLFGRDKDCKLKIEKRDDHYPYFYVPDPDGEAVSIFGQRVKRVQVENPYDVKQMRGGYSEVFEADIHYPNRCIIDEVEPSFDEPIRICFIDIEID